MSRNFSRQIFRLFADKPSRRRGAASLASRRRRPWALEGLENRVLLSGATVYTVTDSSASASDTGSLPYAVMQADADPYLDGSEIEFDPSVFNTTTPQIITLTSTLDLTETTGPEDIVGPGSSVLTISGGNTVVVLSVGSGTSAGVSGLTIAHGKGLGAGISIDSGGSLSITQSIVTDNVGNAGFGTAACIFNAGGSLTIDDSTISDNTGGGINNGGMLTVTDSTIAGNSGAEGGGIFSSGSLQVLDSTIAGNSASDGGGIFASSTLSVTNSTIANNTAVAKGGGIYSDEAGATVVNSTIAYNEVEVVAGGGGIDTISYSVTTLNNTIVALNTDGSGAGATADDVAGAAIWPSSWYNLVGADLTGSLTNGTNGNQIGVVNPGLASGLGDNGGPTQTIALLAGSPAIDAGDTALAVDSSGSPLVYDQRGSGFPRVNGPSVDIGAFELPFTQLAASTTTVASFNGGDGTNPYGGLVRDAAGNLYGTTSEGGAANDGTVFEIVAGSDTITTLASFDDADGASPEGSLVLDAAGNLYGTTAYGGAHYDGTAFEIVAGSDTITTLASFDGTDGAYPYAGLVLDAAGNLYGTTYEGGADNDGTAFEIVAGSDTIATLASFNGGDGTYPFAGLVLDAAGNLYGTTYEGGADNDGTAFEIIAGSDTITTLANFDNTNGANPEGGLVRDVAGNLYGITSGGGDHYDGTVFEIAAGSDTITTLASFNGSDGDYPYAGLVLDAEGNLYGTTAYGGADYDGTVFEIAAGSDTITTLASFNGDDGAYPYAGLVLDAAGNLYGTTYEGGADNDGSVFEIAAGSDTITTLASFDDTDGAFPSAGLVLDAAGNLYGTTLEGGADNDGTVFEIVAGSDTITTLASFNETDGAYSDAGLVLDAAGNLYGTTTDGGDEGTVFEVAAGSDMITTLASFNGSDGAEPNAGLVLDAAGNLYGTTTYGGADGDGTLFEIVAGSDAITTLASFNGDDGADPYAGLVLDAAGNLYGTTYEGGSDNVGTVFEFVVNTSPAASTNTTIDSSANPSAFGTSVTFTATVTPSLSTGLTPTGTVEFFDGSTDLGPGTLVSAGQWTYTTSVLTVSDHSITAVYSGDSNFSTSTSASLDQTVTTAGTTTTVISSADPSAPGESVRFTATVTPTETGLPVPTGTVEFFDGLADLGPGTLNSAGQWTFTTSTLPLGIHSITAVYSGDSDFSTSTSSALDQTVNALESGLVTLASFNAGNGTNPDGGLVRDAAGNLYGTTGDGGADNDGTVFEIAAGSDTITTLASFNYGDGAGPQGSLVLDAAGNLYGATEGGGADYEGTVFEIAAGSDTITTLASFSGGNGASPFAGLVRDAAGNLYGTTVYGGAADDGTVFEIAAGSGTITTLASFNDSDGLYSEGSLVLDAAGDLYGTTEEGGAGDVGTIFEVAAGSGTITTLVSFNGSDGAYPFAGLVIDATGNLYGTTFEGGVANEGTVFEVAAGSDVMTTLASFNYGDGAFPDGSLVLDAQGDLYGTASNGGADGDNGTVFEIIAGSHAITTLAIFDNTDGAIPSGSLVLDAAGNLYGTTEEGGADGVGTVFEVAAGSGTITTLASFNFGDGAYPEGSLVRDAAGNLYGTTVSGGADDYGTVFEIAAGSDTITTLASFDYSDGEDPYAGLAVDAAGNLYGTTAYGGADYDGTVFEIAAGSDTITTLASFNGDDGAYPYAGLVLDAAGNLYGTTYEGGADNDGSVFEIAAGSDTITTLASFNGGDGAYPYAGLVLDAAGNLYGTTLQGGADNYGTVFEIVAGSDTITTLASFNETDGAYSDAGLVLDAAGNLYGTTTDGGDEGTVFEVAAGSDTITTLASFNGSDGAEPNAGLVLDAAGNLYGTTTYGGADGDGTLFEIAAGSDAITTLASFNGDDGANPYAGLLLDAAGNLYGTTYEGGTDGVGTDFEFVVNTPPAASTTTIDSSANPSAFGQSVTFTATVTPSVSTGLTLTGTVEFFDGSTELATETLTGAGQATFSTSSLAIGDHSITAVYSGDSNFSTSTSSALNQAVSAAGTTTSVVSSANPSAFGTSVTFTATVTPVGTGLPVPTGTVEFFDGATELGTSSLNSAGQATFTTSALAAGDNSITAVYSGDSYFSISTSAALDQSVTAAGTTTSVVSSANPSTFGESVMFTATVTPTETGLPVPTGTVEFLDGSTELGLETLNSVGQATFSTSSLASGSHSITAVYGGDSNFSISTSSALNQSVNVLVAGLVSVASFNAGSGTNPYGGLVRDAAGNLYGTTSEGGADNDGTVFEIAAGSDTVTTLASFDGVDGTSPEGSLVVDAAGELYGTTAYGGADNDGTVFEVAAGSGTITTLASFHGTDGAYPYAGLVLDAAGNFYGTTYEGGADGDGTVFELAAGSNTITTLASFNGGNGTYPFAGLVLDPGGNLYGTTYEGGTDNDGTMFEIAAGSYTITTLASFDDTDGANPDGGLVRDAAGNLYGTTQGGTNYEGTVFEIVAGSDTITTLASFNSSDGANPYAGLALDAAGNLYGTTAYGGADYEGTIFEIAAGSGTITTLASFNGSDGAYPYAGLVLDAAGNLYGTTNSGGAENDGTVVEIAAGSDTITTIASFNYGDGAYPEGGLVRDAAGNLYGTTASGGAYHEGTVFEIAAGSDTITTLASFDNSDGAYPYAGLVIDAAGNLYGTTEYGGADYDGTVFEIVAGSDTITTLASFNGDDGAFPEAGLVLDAAGNLYGTTVEGGADDDGTVFEIAAGSGTITTLASFDGGDGAYPYAGLVLDAAGNLYGTTYEGGANGEGTVFEIAAGSGAITTLASFHGSDGADPEGSLVLDGEGNLYGTTEYGGAGYDGTVFEVAAGSDTITTLAGFDDTDGAEPTAGLVLDAAGNLYGTATYGGADADGTLFEIVAGSDAITTLASFNGDDGANPYAGLVLDAAGNLYGTTYEGGSDNVGTVFEFVISPASAASTNTTIDSSANPSAFGTSVTFTATVTPSVSTGLTLTGTVEFFDGSTELATETLNGAGQATFSTSSLAIGDHSITAVYSGDSNFSTSTSSALNQSVTEAGTTTTVVSSANPSAFGESVTFTATVTPVGTGLPIPTGMVEFFDGSTELGVETLNGAGQATFSASTLAVGDNSITAVYSGDSNFSTSTSAALDQSVTAAGTTTTVVSSANPSTFGESVTFTATVTPTGAALPIPTGTVEFFDGSTELGLETLNGAGQATFSTSTLAVGDNSITAVYSGDSNFSTSTSATLDQSVTAAGTTTTVVSSANPLTFGESVTFTATVSPTATGLPVPTGTVEFFDGATELGTGTLNGAGQTTLSTSTLAAGDNSITAVYSGNSDFSTSTSAALNQKVNTAATTTTVVSSANPSAPGESVTFTATVMPVGTGIPVPTGTVEFFDGTMDLGPGTLNSLGQATFSTSTLTAGIHSITAVYSGGSDFSTSTSPALNNQNVENAGPALTTPISLNGADERDPQGQLLLDAAGNLYGTTFGGGADDDGTVFEIAHGNGAMTMLASFDGTDGEFPGGNLVLDAAGNLYGATQSGGAFGDGTVFEISSEGAFTTLASFNGTDGAYPGGSLVLDAAGNLYGTASGGGADSDGTVFEIATRSSSPTIITLASFNGTDGDSPEGGLVEDAAGNFYGTTAYGGAHNVGTVFEIVMGSGTITTLASFDGADGITPVADVVLDAAGNLYGTAVEGGDAGVGTVFEIRMGSGTITALANFEGSNGEYPRGSLVLDAAGNLYGTASGGGVDDEGTVFEIVNGSGTIATVTSFDGPDGELPFGGLVLDTAGNLYGTTDVGGADDHGTVFELPTDFTNINVESSDSASEVGQSVTFTATVQWRIETGRASPTGTVTFMDGSTLLGTGQLDSAGQATFSTSSLTLGVQPITAIYSGDMNFAGSTSGVWDQSVNPTGLVLTTFASFNGTDGLDPEGSLVQDTLGDFYGTTVVGGADGDGTVFKIDPAGNTTTLFSFDGTDGEFPRAVVLDAAGDVYGTTEEGGADGVGTVFKIDPGGNITTLVSFDGADGEYPDAGVVLDAAGDIYGTTAEGGADGDGTVFEISSGGTFTTLFSFDGADGENPTGGLVLDAAGDLYGITDAGGAHGDGTVFKIDPETMSITTLASFNGITGTIGGEPIGSLALDAAGDLYGITQDGGTDDDGTIFEIDTQSSTPTITTLASFNFADGEFPFNGLVLDARGNLYGTMQEGGADDDGTVFELVSGSGTITTLVSFDGTDGDFPVGSLLVDAAGNIYGTTAEGGANGDGMVFEFPNPSPTAAAVTTIESSANPSTFGGSVTFTATCTPVGTGLPVPTGTVEFLDGSAELGTGMLDSAGQATFTTSTLTAGDHSITAVYSGDSHFSMSTSAALDQSVTVADTTTTVTSSANPAVDGEEVSFTATVTNDDTAAPPAGTVEFIVVSSAGTQDYGPYAFSGGTFTSPLIDLYANPGSYSVEADFTDPAGNFAASPGYLSGGQVVNPMTVPYLQDVLDASSTPTVSAATNTDLQTVITAVNGLSAQGTAATITVDLGGGTFDDSTFSPPAGVTVVVVGNGTTTIFVGHSPALDVTQGNVIISDVTFITATDAPTIVVSGGSLTLRDDTIDGSTGFADAAISLTGGTLNLGTAGDPGGNTINISSGGEFLQNLTGTPVPTVGDTFTVNGTPLSAVANFDAAGYQLVASGNTENLVWYGTSGSDQVQFIQTGAGTIQMNVNELDGVATSFTATVTGVTGNVLVNEYDIAGSMDVVDGSGLTTISSVITVGDGNNTLIGGGGANTIMAGDGNNTIYGSGMGNSPNATGVEDPSNTITVGNGNNVIYGNYSGTGYQGGNNTITAGDGNNTIYGNYGKGGPTSDGAEGSNNTITVGNGDDTIYGNYGYADGGEGGSNTIIAGNGNDVIYGNANGNAPQRLCGSNFIQVGNGNDTIFGNLGGDGGEGGNNTILTGSGQDTIYGNFGGDGGEGGNNLIVAGGGNDTIYAHCALPVSSTTSGTTAEGRDLIIGGTGADTVYGWPTGYSLGANTGDLFIAGTTNLSLNALDAVLAEWTSSDSYATRVADISGTNGTVGLNGSNYLIPDTTIFGSAAVDEVFGTVGSDDDWYLVTSNDQLNNVNPSEVTIIPVDTNQTSNAEVALQLVPQSASHIVLGTLSTVTTSPSSSQSTRLNTNSGAEENG